MPCTIPRPTRPMARPITWVSTTTSRSPSRLNRDWTCGASDPASYWSGVIPQVVVINNDGKVLLDESGPVSIDAINEALSQVTGLRPQGDVKLSLNREVNELNSEIVPAP